MIFLVIILFFIGQRDTSRKLIGAENSSVKIPQASFKDSLANAYSIKELYQLDSLFLSKKRFEESELTENKLIRIIRSDHDYIDSKLANKYLSWGIKDIKKGETEKAKREIIFSHELDPSNRHIPLTMAKLSFPNLIKTTKYLWSYILTIKFLNNKVFFIKILILLLILFSF